METIAITRASLHCARMSGEAKSSKSRQFQPPKGTRDFYPQDMAVRRYIESVWRTTSINHGFDEVEGPTFEYLDLYTHKSGPGIASELFQVFSGKDEAERAEIQKTGQAPFALRPEFTPTLARMVAAKADALPKPIKWFAIPSHFRAERPQRGRLREFMQWNVDFIEEPPSRPAQSALTTANSAKVKRIDKTWATPQARADAEVMLVCISALQSFGLTPKDAVVYHTDRTLIEYILRRLGIPVERQNDFTELLDKRAKLTNTEAWHALGLLGLPVETFDHFDQVAAGIDSEIDKHWGEIDHDMDVDDQVDHSLLMNMVNEGFENLSALRKCLEQAGVSDWCKVDHSIVRGLAYYTTTVFEVHELSGAERAIAGGGRYDNLIESFGGPKLPACGFGMGDVVLGNILHDKGLLPEEVYMEPLQPHAFVIAADDNAAGKLPGLVASLRKEGFHIRHSYKTTRNVGKLLGDAAKSRARYAIILGKELAESPPSVAMKNLASGEQMEMPFTEIASQLKAANDEQG
jgi:histidyl-tRNA synthetase